MPAGNAGPPGDHSTGSGSLWGTNVSGTTNNCEDSKLVSPTIDLSAYAGKTVLLRMWHWFDFRDCTPNGFLCPDFACMLDMDSYSGGIVEVLSGSVWTQVTPVGGYGNGGQQISCSYTDAACTTCSLEGKTGFSAAGAENVWSQASFDISPYVSAGFRVRFSYASHDAYTCYPKTGGWYLDDIEIGTQEACSP
jgi:hypothetical protein